MALRPRRVLEVGLGPGILARLLTQAGIEVLTVDLDPSLRPHLVASVADLPLGDDACDLAAAFQVLEHLPYDLFPAALSQLRRVARRHVVISLPDARRFLQLTVHLPLLGDRSLLLNLPGLAWPAGRRNPMHQWEVNLPGFPLRRILSTLRQAGLEPALTYRLKPLPYQRLFVLHKAAPHPSR